MQKTLADLKKGESGIVQNVSPNNPQTARRLIDMGITCLALIQMIDTAPLGDPIRVMVRDSLLTLRKDDAKYVLLYATKEEEDKALKEEEKAKQERKLRTVDFIKDHNSNQDIKAHQHAAKLTDWVISGNEDIRFPIEDNEGFNAQSPCIGCGKRGCGVKCKSKKVKYKDSSPVKLALVGNPNSGKTTLFNALTGKREYVGNWPGVTVEKKEGRFKAHGHDMALVDLPGVYSLSPYSLEEIIARNFIIEEKPDAIINIVDGTNLERNLYLTLQLMELTCPMIIALNMMDEVEKKGDKIDAISLALELGVPVVPISARTGEGIPELLKQCQKLMAIVHEQVHQGFNIEPDDVYDDATHAVHHAIGEIIEKNAMDAGLPLHWASIKLMEGDILVSKSLSLTAEQRAKVEIILNKYISSGLNGEMLLADSRYRYISGICKSAIIRGAKGASDIKSYNIDKILTNKYLALPLFFIIMLLIFALTFGTIGAWCSEKIGFLINDYLSPAVYNLLQYMGVSYWLISLIVDGVIAGMGAVLGFLPQIALLFLCLSFLEDSGYLPRTAFIMDKPLKRFGLSGKSFIPMLMGFGCTVPATLGCRTMDNERHRRMTILLLPFMSCSAKLPVYGLIAGAFFGKQAFIVVFFLYLLGILMGIFTGMHFKAFMFKGKEAPFVMEMPPYRWPTLGNTLLHVGERVTHFIEKAGTIILFMSIILWFAQSFDTAFVMVKDARESILGKLGAFIAPIFTPLGFGGWQAAVALLTGIFAKEAVVASLSLFYGFSASGGQDVVLQSLSSTFTPLSAISFLVFVLLYVPCVAAVATMRRELQSFKYTLFMVGYQILLAYGLSFIIYQIGLLLL